MKDPDESLDEQMSRIAKDVSWRYARRCWWQDQQEIEQQAWTVILEVKEHYAPRDPTGAIDRNAFGAVAYAATMRQISRWMWRESSPVSTTDHDVKNMAGVHRAWLGHTDTAEFSPRSPENLVAEKHLLKSIRERILKLCGDTMYVRATLLVLLEGDVPREVAASLGLEVYGIYRTTEWVKLVLKSDKKILKLAEELKERRW